MTRTSTSVIGAFGPSVMGAFGLCLGVVAALGMNPASAVPVQASGAGVVAADAPITQPGATPEGAAAADTAYLPLALNAGRLPNSPIATSVVSKPTQVAPTPDPTTTMPASPTPDPMTATPAAEPDHGPVVLQAATFGGLSIDVSLGWLPTQAPWFTLYADGAYIRSQRSADGALDRYDLVIGQMTQEQKAALVARFTEEAHFFDLIDRAWTVFCMTDQPDTYVWLESGGRSHRVVTYALDEYLHNESPCHQGPADPGEVLLVALAEAVDDLKQSRPSERPYAVQNATFIVGREIRDPSEPPPPLWPLGLRLADVAGANAQGEVQLEAGSARDVLAAIAGGRRRYLPVADFREDGLDYIVGLRVEVPGWQTYRSP